VSSETDYVIAGEGAGSKLNRARELDVAVLDEEAFWTLMNDLGISIPGEGEGQG
jgi:DNA ligase (NAD+)